MYLIVGAKGFLGRRSFRLYGSEGLPQKADAGAPCKGGAGTETGDS